MNQAEYKKITEEKSPNSKLGVNMIKAFVVGGGICVLGEGIRQYFLWLSFSQEMTAAAVAIILVFLSALFTGLGWYDDIGRFAGGGSLVPITGFANAVVSPAIEYKSEGYILGVGAKMFIIAGPVLVYGIISSVIVGLIHFFFG